MARSAPRHHRNRAAAACVRPVGIRIAPGLDFHHIYQPPSTHGLPTLLMLHGTGGNEHDLLPLAATLLPGAGVLSPRGKVLEGTMPRFFRRLSEGVFDLDDLK